MPGYSGCFEVYFRGKRIWSKLNGQGRLRPKDIPKLIDYMKS